MSPEERIADYEESFERDLCDIDVAEQLADESRHAIDWPPITDEKLIALARQRLAMEA